MITKIKDLTREFSEIEVNIIKEFGQKISADKIELHRISQIGSSSYWLFTGLICIEVQLMNQDAFRCILVTSQHITEGQHSMSNELKNPSELTEYLNELTRKILITE
tara:strand:- start:218 stop:538 length:321 start_codon:yes stop_codon:yes gene_type:complete